MTEEKVIKVSDMIRTTAENSGQFMQQIADHIDKLEDGIVKLQTRIEELEKQNVLNDPAQ
jgi:phage shock protein A